MYNKFNSRTVPVNEKAFYALIILLRYTYLRPRSPAGLTCDPNQPWTRDARGRRTGDFRKRSRVVPEVLYYVISFRRRSPAQHVYYNVVTSQPFGPMVR